MLVCITIKRDKIDLYRQPTEPKLVWCGKGEGGIRKIVKTSVNRLIGLNYCCIKTNAGP